MTASTVEFAAMPKGLVAETGPAADELAPPPGVLPVPEEAQAASNPPVGNHGRGRERATEEIAALQWLFGDAHV